MAVILVTRIDSSRKYWRRALLLSAVLVVLPLVPAFGQNTAVSAQASTQREASPGVLQSSEPLPTSGGNQLMGGQPVAPNGAPVNAAAGDNALSSFMGSAADSSAQPVGAVPTTAPSSSAGADPLAQFRASVDSQNATVQPAGTPAPTPGGFQQPVGAADAAAMQNYDLDIDAEVEAQQAELDRKAREDAFKAALDGTMPLQPGEIRELLDRYRGTREAAEGRIGGHPKPEVTFKDISLDPGAVPPTIKLSPGHVTTVAVLDLTGQPWPIQDVSWGGDFEVQSPKEGSHVLRISPMGAVSMGNLSVMLLGLKTPVTFTLDTQQDVVQYRFDARIPEYGPNALPPMIDPGVTTVAGDTSMIQVLEGALPSGATKMDVSGVDGRTTVYRLDQQVYLRTPLTLLSPGWDSSVKSADGMTVYAIGNSPVLLLSDRGKMVRAMIEENRTLP